MQLCFDATRFGCGLDGAVELARDKGLKAVEFCFAPFPVSAKSNGLDDKERKYLKKVNGLCGKNGIVFACLNLDYSVDPGDKKSIKKCVQMMSKLILVAEAIGCPRVSFGVSPGDGDNWKGDLSEEVQKLQALAAEHNVHLLLRLSTPSEFRGQSLKKWKAMEPQDWRDLISLCPGLSLSFSPADCVWLGIDYLQILSGITSAVEHIEAHDVEVNRNVLMDSGMFGPLWWRYRLPGKGQVDWRQLIEALKLYDYKGTLSINLDDEFIDSEQESLEHALDSGIKFFTPLLRG